MATDHEMEGNDAASGSDSEMEEDCLVGIVAYSRNSRWTLVENRKMNKTGSHASESDRERGKSFSDDTV